MADVISVERGAPPWRPSQDAELIATYLHYDIPLVGVVSQHNVEYLFTCLVGRGETMSVWFYGFLSKEARAELEHAPDPSAFDQAALEILGRGHVVAAMALENVGVLASRVMDDMSDQSMEAAIDGMVETIVQELQAVRSAV